MGAKDWASVKETLAGDVEVFWPATREVIRGRQNVVAVNAEYPTGWSIEVLNVYSAGEVIVSEVQVPQEGVGVFRVVSLWTVVDNLIVSGREYWIAYGGDDVPAWRRPYVELAAD